MLRNFCAVLFISILAIACSPNNVKTDAFIAKKLDSAGLQGSFALLENGTEVFTIHNLARYKDSASAPLGSFFVIPTLLAIDKGFIHQNPSSWIVMDSTLAYQKLMAQLGRPVILQAIDSLHYGKGIVSGGLDSFWSDNSLQITADEQLGLIKKLYFNELYFQKRSQEILKKILLKEDNANYKLSYIAAADTAHANACWIVGYVEENKHPYFFVLNTNANDKDDLLNKNIQVLKSILIQQGFLKGVR